MLTSTASFTFDGVDLGDIHTAELLEARFNGQIGDLPAGTKAEDFISDIRVLEPGGDGVPGQVQVDFTGDNALFEALDGNDQVTLIAGIGLTDQDGASDRADVEFTLLGANDAPLAFADFSLANEDATVLIDVLLNDFDPDGDAVSVVSIEGVDVSAGEIALSSGAFVSLDDTGQILYNPLLSADLQALEEGDVFGDTFTYTIADADGLESTATVLVSVEGRDELAMAPITPLTQQATIPAQSGSLYGGAVSPDGQEIAVIQQFASTIDFYDLSGSLLRQIPLPGDNGNDGDLFFANGPSSLNGVDLPAGTLFAMSGDSGTADIFALDAETGTVLATLSTEFGSNFVVGADFNPSTGTLYLLSCNCDNPGNEIAEIDPATGSVIRRFNLDDVDFQTFFGDLAVDPTTGDLLIVTDQQPEILRLSSDFEVVERLTVPNGVSGLSGIGIPDAGTGSFFVMSTNGNVFELSDDPQLAVNLAPVVTPFTATVTEDDGLVILEILDAADDPEDDALTVVNLVQQMGRDVDGRLEDDTLVIDLASFNNLQSTGTGTVLFDYDVFDGVNTVTNTARITVTGVNDDVVSQDDNGFTTDESSRLSILPADLLENDDDPDLGDLLRISGVSAFSAGGASVTFGNGEIVYDPNGAFDNLDAGQSQVDTFTYTVTDDRGSTDTATVSVLVTGVNGNSAPVVSTLMVTTNEDAGIEVFDLLQAPNVSDPDGDVLSVSNLSQLGGTTLLSANAAQIVGQSLEFDTGAFNGLSINESELSTFGYNVSDGEFSVPNSIEITVEGRNDAPVFGNLSFQNPTAESVTSVQLLLAAGVSDPDVNDQISVQNIVQTAGRDTGFTVDGTELSFNVAGFFDDLSAGVLEDIVFEYEVTDGTVALPRSFSLQIEGENDPVIAQNDGGDAPVGLRLFGGTGHGQVVAAAGDVNGDGVDDVVVSAPSTSANNNFRSGQSFVVFGNAAGLPVQIDVSELDGTDGFLLSGIDPFDDTGFALAAAGDFNGDGIDDLIFGAANADQNSLGNQTSEGEAYVVFGTDQGFPRELIFSDLDGTNGFLITGINVGDMTGDAVSSAGDIDGDGAADIAITAPGSDINGTYSGQTTILFGGSDFGASFDLRDVDGTNGFVFNGPSLSLSGTSVTSISDLNGDGISDLAIGAPGSSVSPPGLVFVGFGDDGDGFGRAFEISDFSAGSGFILSGVDAFDNVGESIADAGDFNGDGINDLLIGNPAGEPDGQETGDDRGEVFVLFGSDLGFPTALTVDDLTGATGLRITGLNPGDALGDSVDGVGDVNGDGVDDILIGASLADPLGYATGQSYLVFGDDGGFPNGIDLATLDGTNGYIFNGQTVGGIAGRSVAGAGDVNGDGVNDLIIGAPSNGSSGESFVVFGGTALSALDGDGDGVIALGDVASTVQPAFVTDEGSTLTIDPLRLLANDFDPDSDDVLSILSVADRSTEGAALRLVGGQVIYDPDGAFDQLDDGQLLVDTFTYTVTDGQGATDTATVSVTINGVSGNSAPVVSTLMVTTNEDAGVEVFDLLQAPEISDPDNDVLTVSNLSQLGGTTLLSSNAAQIVGQSLEFDTGAFNGLSISETELSTFGYDVSDGQFTVQNSIEVTVEGRNDAPMFSDLSFVNFLPEDQLRANRALDLNVVDPDVNDVISVLNLVQIEGRDVSFELQDNRLLFDIDGSFEDLAEGEAEIIVFTLEIFDGTIALPRTVETGIIGLNDAPVGTNDTGDVGESGTVTLDVIGNDFDIDAGDVLQIVSLDVVSPLGALLDIVGTNEIRYDTNGAFEDLAEGETLVDTFTYQLADSQGVTAEATVEVTITGENDQVIAVNDTDATDEDTAISILGADLLSNDFDPDLSDVIEISDFSTSGTLGQVSFDGTDFLYDPSGAFDFLRPGETATDTFDYTVSDGNGSSADGVVTVTISGIDDNPIGRTDILTTNQNTSITSEVLSNDIDPDGTLVSARLTVAPDGFADRVVDFNFTGSRAPLDPANALGAPDGEFVSLPTGTTITLSFEEVIIDGPGADFRVIEEINTERALVEASADGVNFVSFGEIRGTADFDLADSVTLDAVNHVRLTGLDNGGSSPGFDLDSVEALNTANAQGVRVLGVNNILDYDPNGNFDGLGLGESAVERFTYVLTDDAGNTATALVEVTVEGLNDPVVAVEDLGFVTDEANSLQILADELTGNDFELDLNDVLTVTDVTASASGAIVTLVGDTITYDPNGAFDGLAAGESTTDTFTYSVSDGSSTDDGLVEVTITGLSQAVTGGSDIAQTDEDTALDLLADDLLANDVGDGLTISAVDASSLFGAVISFDGSTITYDPRGVFDALADGEVADDTFTYTVTDVVGNTDDVTVSVQVDGLNDDPIASFGVGEVSLISLNVAGTSDGDQGVETMPSISADGTAVAFVSTSTDLVPGDNNDVRDLFLRDLTSGETQRVNVQSVTGAESPAGIAFTEIAVSGDGNRVVFSADDPDLDPDSAASGVQIYLRDIAAGTTELISVSTNGNPGNGTSNDPSISDDGRFVAFTSTANNLIDGQTILNTEVYVRDTLSNATLSVSLLSGASVTSGFTNSPVISGDGSVVAFATNKALVPEDTNGRVDFYATNLTTGEVQRVSTNNAGADLASGGAPLAIPVNGFPSISSDGRLALFLSAADNIDEDDQNSSIDVYIRDLRNGTTELAVANLSGLAPEDDVFEADISADGRFITFRTTSRDLVPGEAALTNQPIGVFVHDRQTGETQALNVDDTGARVEPTTAVSPVISDDGQTIAFSSFGSGNAALDPLASDARNIFVSTLQDPTRLPDLIEPVNSGTSFFNLLDGFVDPEGGPLSGELISITSTNASRDFDAGIVDADGILDVENRSFQDIAAGATETITIRFGVLDEDGGSITAEKSFDLIGVNDAPVVFPFVTNASTDEDSGLFLIDLSAVAEDEDGDPVTLENLQLVTGKRTLFAEDFEDDAAANTVSNGGFLPVSAGSGLLDQFEVISGEVDIRNNTLGSQGGALDLDGSNLSGTTPPGTFNPASRIQTREEFTFQAGFEYELIFTLESNALSTERDTVFVSIPSFVGQTIDIEPGAQRETFAFRFSTGATVTSPLIFEMRGDSDFEGAILDNITLTEAPTARLNGSDFELITNRLNDLSEGETRTLIFTYDASDGVLADQGRIEVDVAGRNDAVTAVGEDFTIGENGDVVVALEDLLSNEIDPDLGDVLTITDVDTVSDLGVPILISDLGVQTVVYSPGRLFDDLVEGDSVTDFFTYTVDDGNGSVDTATVQITINGENDVPVVSPGAFSITEDSGDQTFDLAPLVDDPDAGTVLSFDNLELTSGGVLIFAEDFLDEVAAAGLAPDASVGNFTAFDQFFVSAGSVDLLLQSGDVVDAVIDLDGSSAVGTNTPAGQIETVDEILLLSATTYTLSFDLEGNPAQGEDDRVQVVFGSLLDETITLSAGAAEQRFEFTFTTDTNESIDLSFTNLGANDGDGLLLSDIELRQIPEVSLDSTGQLLVNADDLDALPDGVQEAVTFSYTVNDSGADIDGGFTLTVEGVNDTPVGGLVVLSTDEDTRFSVEPSTLAESNFDPDFGDLIEIDAVDATSSQGALVTTTATTVVYDPSGFLDSLAEGETVTDAVNYTFSDQSGTPINNSFEITVTGVNDQESFSGGDTLGSVTEDSGPATLTDSGVLDFVDSDLSDIHSLEIASVTPGALGGFQALITDQSTGDGAGQVTWSFSLDNAEINDFAEGELITQEYILTVSDGIGQTDSVTVTVELNGANDVPTVELSPLTATLDETDDPFTFDLSTIVNDPDLGDALSFSGLTSAMSTTLFAEDFEDEGDATFTSTPGTVQSQDFTAFDQFQVTAGSVDLQRNFQLAGVGTEVDLDGSATPGTQNPAGQIETIQEIAFQAGFEYELTFNTRGQDTLNVSIGSLFDEDISVDHGFAAQQLVTRTFRPINDVSADLVITNLGVNDNVGVFLSDIQIVERALADLDAEGNFSFDPGLLADALEAGESAQVDFTYTVSDGLASDTGAIEITVNGVGDPLIATADVPGENRQGGLILNGVNTGDRVGEQVTEIGDFNGDGIGDIAVSAPFSTPGSLPNAGSTYVVFGNGDIDQLSDLDLASLDGSNGFRIDGFVGEIQAGSGLSNAGDLNGDGFDDLLIAAPENYYYAYDARTYVLFGETGIGTDGVIELDEFAFDGTTGFVIVSNDGGTTLDNVVGDLGDVNGDGFDDIGIKPTNGSRVEILFGAADIGDGGLFNISQIDGNNGFFIEDPAGDPTRFSLGFAAGDIDGDGIDEAIFGTTNLDNYAGGVVVLRGDAGLGANGLGAAGEFEIGGSGYTNLTGTNGFVLFGPANQNRFGEDVDTGDLNGDGIEDLAITAGTSFRDGRLFEGRVYVLLGQDGLGPVSENTLTFDDPAVAAQTVTFRSAVNTYLGDVVVVGDVNGDGIDDLLIGSGGVVPFPGVSYLVFGSESLGGTTVDLDTLDGTNGYRFVDSTPFGALGDGGPVSGEVISSAGDLNNDGLADLLLGAPRFEPDTGFTNFGQATVIYGGSFALDQIDALDPSGADGVIDLAFVATPTVGQLTTDEDTPLIFSAALLAENDIDPEGNDITVTAVDATTSQGIALDFDGTTITYDPTATFQSLAAGETATDSFSYTISAGSQTATGLATLSIVGANDAPTGPASLALQQNRTDRADTLGPAPGDVVDPDAGDTLLFSATLAGGADLPTFLDNAFSTATGTFGFDIGDGTGDQGLYWIETTVDDQAGGVASFAYDLAVNDVDIIGTAAGEELVTADSGGTSELLRSGAGRDRLQGGDGTDIYVYTSGDAFDAILDNGFADQDALLFEDFDLADASFSRFVPDENELLISFNDADNLRVISGLSTSVNQIIESYNFADGSTLTTEEIRGLIVGQLTTAGDDTILGFGGTEGDVLVGSGGNDLLSGQNGSDIYRYSLGDGDDIIDDNGFTDTDQVILEGVSRGDLTFSRSLFGENDLLISLPDGGSIQIVDALNGSSQGQIEEFVILDDAATLTVQEVREIIIGDASTDFADSIMGFRISDDTIDGGLGDDLLIGRDGSDLYIYDASLRSGNDVIDDNGFNATDVLRIDGIDSADVEARRVFDTNSLEIELTDGAGNVVNTITLNNQLEASTNDQIENVVFSQDGLTLSADDLRDAVIAKELSDGFITLTGFNTSEDTLIADRGTKVLSGRNQSDTYQADASAAGDIVIIDDGNGDADRLEIANVFAPLTATRAAAELEDLVLTADILQVRIVGGLDNTTLNTIEVVQEGTLGDTAIADLRARVIAAENTELDDFIFGTSSDDTITLNLGDDFLDLSLGGGDELTINAGSGTKFVYTDLDNDTDTLILSGTATTDLDIATLAFAEDVVVLENQGFDQSVVLLNGLDARAFESVVLDDQSFTGEEFIDAVSANATGFDLEVGDTGADTLTAGPSALDHVALQGLGGADIYEVTTDSTLGELSASFVEIFDNGLSSSDTLVLRGFTLDAYRFEIVSSNKDGNTNLAELDEGDLLITTPDENDILIHNAFAANGRIETFRVENAFSATEFTLDDIRAIAVDTQFTSEDDTIIGTELVDTITTQMGGEDVLRGIGSNDIYVINEVFNQSTVIDDLGTSGGDVVEIRGLTVAEAAFSRVPGDEDDLIITDQGGFDRTILIKNTLNDNFFGGIETIRLDDGDIDMDTIRSQIFQNEATDADDTIIGSTVADTLLGSLGNDVLSGRNGSDIYDLDASVIGNVLIDDNGFGNTDEVILRNINISSAEFRRDLIDTDTLILDLDTGSQVTIRNSLSDNSQGGIETLTFVDVLGVSQSLSMLEIRTLLLDQTSTDDDDIISGFTVADTIEGGAGNDVIEGRGGSDLYIFNPGDGQDTIDDNGSFSTDMLDIGFESAALELGRTGADGDDAILSFQGTTDQITVIGGFSTGQADQIEQFQFIDVTLTTQELRQRFLDEQVTAGDDVITGFNGAETLSGGLGDDTLIGSTGSDIYLIEIGDGADMIEDRATSSSNADEIRFVGRNFSDVSFSLLQPGLDDVLIEAGSDQIIVVDAIGGNGSIEFYLFDDLLLTRDEMETLL
ncbi:MAG: tandem-95 repeat protein [Pseudomonadota bacterium]